MCYFPLGLPHPAGLAKANYMLGNEVAFDDVAAFNRAMASPVRQELPAHFRAFPPFSGANTHWPDEAHAGWRVICSKRDIQLRKLSFYH